MAQRKYKNKEERWLQKPRNAKSRTPLSATKAIAQGKKVRATLKCRPNKCKVISYGGGVDSFTMLLTALKRREKPDAVVFVDVSDGGPTWKKIDPGEWPGTYQHIREVVMPLLKKHGIHFRWLTHRDYAIRGGTPGEARSLFQWFKERGQIPIVKKDKRNCTIVAKVERFESWLDDHFPGERVQVWIGFDAAEQDRIEKDPNVGSIRPGISRRVNRFPLMAEDLCRCRSVDLIRKTGHPVPRKSACVFCGMGTRKDFQNLFTELPGEAKQIVELERAKGKTGQGMELSIKGYSTYYKVDGKRITDKGAREYGYDSPPKLWKAAEQVGRDPTVRRLRHRGKFLRVKRVPDPTPLPEYIKQPDRSRQKICIVCGQEAATKETACSYLEDPPPTGKKGKSLTVIQATDLTRPKPKPRPKPRPVREPLLPVAATRRKPGEIITAEELLRRALAKLR